MSSESEARVALVAIGDELLAGKHPDLNSPWMAEQLLDLDLAVDRITVANDDLEELSALFADLCARYEFVFASGGLGPTLDDVTRHAAARACGVELERNEEELAGLRAWFIERGREMVAANERQALFPAGAIVIANPVGTAPAFRVRAGDSWLTCLPGPPRELQTVFAQGVLPWLETASRESGAPHGTAKRAFYLFGMPESQFAEQVGDWMKRPQNPLMSVTVSSGVLTAVLRARAASVEAASELLEPRALAFRERFAAHIISEENGDLAAALGGELLRANKTIATAESCTGGKVAARLTDQPGISAAFSHGFVTYANRAKVEQLGLPQGLLDVHGAVSAEVAGAMAEGACRVAESDLAISITGIAGPSGGSTEKPVGLVWFGVAKRTEGGVSTQTVRRDFPNLGRDWIRTLATQTALNLARVSIAGDVLPDLD